MKKEGASEIGLFAAVLGVLSIVIPLAGFPFGVFMGTFSGVILGIIAIVMGVKAGRQEKTVWSKTAIVTGIIGIVLSIILLVWAVSFLAAVGQKLIELQEQGLLDAPGVAQ